MKERKTYIGKVNGVAGIFCDIKPENIELEKEITFYSPDEGKVFVDKEGNMLDSIILNEGETIDAYHEIVKPKTEEEQEA